MANPNPKTAQVLKMYCDGTAFTVIYHHNVEFNRYWLYCERYGHKSLITKYDDMKSCLYQINLMI